MLPVIRVSLQEKDICGCPIMLVAGLECVALWQVQEAFGLTRNEALKKMACPEPRVLAGTEPSAPAEEGTTK